MKVERPLAYSNCWEADEYTVDGKAVKKLTKVRINGKPYMVHGKVVSVPYYDHGHQGYGTSMHYFLKKKVSGVDMEFDLNKIIRKVSVVAVEWEEA